MTTPGSTATQPPLPLAVRSLIYGGITVLLVAGMVDHIRGTQRRAAHRLAESWARLERRERGHARRAEIALLASRLGPARPSPPPGS